MKKAIWLAAAGTMALSLPAWAQDKSGPVDAATAASPDTETSAGTAQAAEVGDIIVTATRRNQALSNVPLAVSAVTAETLRHSGASDIRQLNQLSPSLLVTTTQSEASGGVARIRGIGTVGDNAGLESAVGVFIDGVYRARAGVALTELGAIDRIEVLRGPQGTLFGRNTSAGLIHVHTAKPRFEDEGTAELSYGNYDYWRGTIGLTGPINQSIAYRLDGVYVKRDGFFTDVNSGRSINDRDRWLARGQLLFRPDDDLEIRLIGDYADRDEECCAASYLPSRNITRNPDGSLNFSPSTVQALLNSFGAGIQNDTYARRTPVTPGRTYRQDVRDWGVSGEINYDFGGAKLTSISAYRDWRLIRGQDADYNNLDLFVRPDDGNNRQRFQTFTQEIRLQGTAFGDVLDWLVGGYYADEKLTLHDNLQYGSQYGSTFSCLVSANINAAISPTSPGCISPAVRAGFAAQAGAAATPILTSLDRLQTVSGAGNGVDTYVQKSRNYALFTHNIVNVTDALSLTLGVRYTNERKRLNADLEGNPNAAAACAANAAALVGIRDNAALPASLRTLAGTILSLSCVFPPVAGVSLSDTKKEDEFSGTAVLSYELTPDLLAYASYSKGYKAGGFNLDRQALNAFAPGGFNVSQLRFAPEKVDAFEIGAKYDGRGIDLNIAAFYQLFKSFQLNGFTGTAFVVENIEGCTELAGGDGADSDNLAATGACTGKSKAGVVSKGVEIEAFLRPARNLSTNLGFTLSDTRYRDNLTGANGTPLGTPFFQLPGSRLSNAAQYTVSGAMTWTPPIGTAGLHALIYGDFRYQSEMNTGSDLDLEKWQEGVMLVNARIGLQGPEQAWSVELWGQNLFDAQYKQIAIDAPIQGSGTIRGTRAFGTPSTALFGAFLAEPRTYGITLRSRF